MPRPAKRSWRPLATDTTAVAPRSARDCLPAAPDLLERYSLFLTGQRALSDNTKRIYLDDLRTFLAYCRQQGMTCAT